jgi:ubiquinone/menaquinone biosynthesis C-methylase UbiE
LSAPATDKVFSGSVPKLYEEYMVPLIFEPYAADLAQRAARRLESTRAPALVLEVAAGTGVVTRHLAATLPASASIVATDLNAPMLAMAAQIGTVRPVDWRTADAMQLPFEDASVDAVVCQFGVMFFPDRPHAYAEARRVLRPGGVFLFNAWDRIEENELADVVTAALATVFPEDPPRFMARTPHGYHDVERIAADLAGGGFDATPEIVTLAARSRAPSARIAAVAYCQGTPLRGEIEARDAARLGEATDVAERRIEQRFGTGPIDTKIQAHVIAIQR